MLCKRKTKRSKKCFWKRKKMTVEIKNTVEELQGGIDDISQKTH